MVNIVENPTLSIMVKVVIIGLLLYYLVKRMLMATDKQLYISNYIINLMHIVYIIMFLMIKNCIKGYISSSFLIFYLQNKIFSLVKYSYE